jgi:hypothetical protein
VRYTQQLKTRCSCFLTGYHPEYVDAYNVHYNNILHYVRRPRGRFSIDPPKMIKTLIVSSTDSKINIHELQVLCDVGLCHRVCRSSLLWCGAVSPGVPFKSSVMWGSVAGRVVQFRRLALPSSLEILRCFYGSCSVRLFSYVTLRHYKPSRHTLISCAAHFTVSIATLHVRTTRTLHPADGGQSFLSFKSHWT